MTIPATISILNGGGVTWGRWSNPLQQRAEIDWASAGTGDAPAPPCAVCCRSWPHTGVTHCRAVSAGGAFDDGWYSFACW
jgi:hypothetical protein